MNRKNMLKNIIYITGNDTYGVEKELSRFVKVFEEKYSGINIDRYRLEDKSMISHIRDNLFTVGLFSEKRLFIFSWWWEWKGKKWWFEEILTTLGENLPEDHFCIFHSVDKKEVVLIQWLEKYADVRSINTLWSKEAWEKRFPDLEEKVIEKVISLYKESEWEKEDADKNVFIGHMIAHSLEVSTLYEWEKEYALEDIAQSIGASWKIFSLIDAIMQTEQEKALSLFKKIVGHTSWTEVLSSLIWLLRNNLYILYVREKRKDIKSIPSMWRIHPFVQKKAMSSKISFEKLSSIYNKLININIRYKSGKGMKDSELWRILEIELVLFELKK